LFAGAVAQARDPRVQRRPGDNLATGLGTINAQLFVPERARAAR
jgi:hypothetical protein